VEEKMRILIAFIVAFGIGAASSWTRVPSPAPQAILGALLIVAMSTGDVSADRLLKRTASPTVSSACHFVSGSGRTWEKIERPYEQQALQIA
jgi:XapX domain-containing protein